LAETTFSEILNNQIVTLIVVAAAFFGAGAYLTKLKINISQSKKSKQQEEYFLLNELKGRIKWINEMQGDIQKKITTTISEEVETAYQALIEDLNAHKEQLQRAIDGAADRQQEK
jgi:hypothetical protein